VRPEPPEPQETAVRAPVLAVLPFTALCGEERSFAAGLTDELIHAAERSARFRAAPRSIMFQFRETRYSLDVVAAEAGADLVLHGTVRRAQEVRRIAVELSNRWGQILWSDRIDVAGDDDLAAQERIAGEILMRLPAALAEAS
jgi:TolB-like protein